MHERERIVNLQTLVDRLRTLSGKALTPEGFWQARFGAASGGRKWFTCHLTGAIIADSLAVVAEVVQIAVGRHRPGYTFLESLSPNGNLFQNTAFLMLAVLLRTLVVWREEYFVTVYLALIGSFFGGMLLSLDLQQQFSEFLASVFLLATANATLVLGIVLLEVVICALIDGVVERHASVLSNALNLKARIYVSNTSSTPSSTASSSAEAAAAAAASAKVVVSDDDLALVLVDSLSALTQTVEQELQRQFVEARGAVATVARWWRGRSAGIAESITRDSCLVVDTAVACPHLLHTCLLDSLVGRSGRLWPVYSGWQVSTDALRP